MSTCERVGTPVGTCQTQMWGRGNCGNRLGVHACAHTTRPRPYVMCEVHCSSPWQPWGLASCFENSLKSVQLKWPPGLGISGQTHKWGTFNEWSLINSAHFFCF